MPLTTAALVQGVVEHDGTAWPDLAPFINAADMVSRRVVQKAPSLTDDDALFYDMTDADDIADVTLIETHLAAHFYSVSDPRSEQEAAGSVRVTYEGDASEGLTRTRYGQSAISLDVSGALAAWNAKTKQKLKPTNSVTKPVGLRHLGGTRTDSDT